jgi:hypothetical protein
VAEVQLRQRGVGQEHLAKGPRAVLAETLAQKHILGAQHDRSAPQLLDRNLDKMGHFLRKKKKRRKKKKNGEKKIGKKRRKK